jgi:YVTN family beta-propeller protein
MGKFKIINSKAYDNNEDIVITDDGYSYEQLFSQSDWTYSSTYNNYTLTIPHNLNINNLKYKYEIIDFTSILNKTIYDLELTGLTINNIKFDGYYFILTSSGCFILDPITTTYYKLLNSDTVYSDVSYLDGYFYCIISASNVIVKIDSNTNTISTTITITSVTNPTYIENDGTYLFVGGNTSLKKITTDGSTFNTEIDVSKPCYTMVGVDDYIWCSFSSYPTTNIIKIDSNTDTITTTIAMNSRDSWALSYNDEYIFNVSSESGVNGSLQQINATTNAIITHITIPEGIISLESTATQLFMGRNVDNTILKYSISPLMVVTTITVSSVPQYIIDNGIYGSIWVSCSGGTLNKISRSTGLIQATVTVNTPHNLIFIESDVSVWVTNYSNGTICKIDPGSNTIVQTITVGTNPQSIAYDGTYLWVTNYGDATVSKINYSTSLVEQTIPVASNPFTIVYHNNYVWVGHYIEPGTNIISKIDTTLNVVTTLSGTVNNIRSYNNNIWASTASSYVDVVDTSNMTKESVNVGIQQKDVFPNCNGSLVLESSLTEVYATVTVEQAPEGIAFDGTYIWCASRNGTGISKVNPTSMTKVSRVTTGTSTSNLVYDGTYLWVTENDNTSIIKVDPTTEIIQATYNMGAGSGPYDITVDSNGYIWVADISLSKIYKVNPNTGIILVTIQVGGRNIYFDGTYIWGHSNSSPDYRIIKIDINTNTILSTVTITNDPQQMVSDGTNLWVVNYGIGSIDKINISSMTITGNIATGLSGRGIAFDDEYIYYVTSNDFVVLKINPTTTSVVATITINSSDAYSGFYLNNNIWVSDLGNDTLYKLNNISSNILKISTTLQVSTVIHDSINTHNSIYADNKKSMIVRNDGLVKIMNNDYTTILSTITVSSNTKSNIDYNNVLLYNSSTQFEQWNEYNKSNIKTTYTDVDNLQLTSTTPFNGKILIKRVF